MDASNASQTSLNSSTVDVVGVAASFLTMTVVLPENIYVIWLIVSGAGNGVSLEFFSLNLCICELFYCLRTFLTYLNTTCLGLVVAFLTGFPITGRPLFQFLICIERYIAVIHPVTFLKYQALRYRIISAIIVWCGIILNGLFLTFNVIDIYVFLCICVSQGLFTLFVQLVCCLSILRALKKSGPGDRKKEEENHMKRRAFNTILLITMAILLIYAGYLVAGIIYMFTKEFIGVIWSIGQLCFLLGGLVQPVLYVHRTGKLLHFAKLLGVVKKPQ